MMNLQKVHAAMIKRAAEENKSFGDKWYEYNQAKMEADPGIMFGKWVRNRFGKKPAPKSTANHGTEYADYMKGKGAVKAPAKTTAKPEPKPAAKPSK